MAIIGHFYYRYDNHPNWQATWAEAVGGDLGVGQAMDLSSRARIVSHLFKLECLSYPLA